GAAVTLCAGTPDGTATTGAPLSGGPVPSRTLATARVSANRLLESSSRAPTANGSALLSTNIYGAIVPSATMRLIMAPSLQFRYASEKNVFVGSAFNTISLKRHVKFALRVGPA